MVLFLDSLFCSIDLFFFATVLYSPKFILYLSLFPSQPSNRYTEVHLHCKTYYFITPPLQQTPLFSNSHFSILCYIHIVHFANSAQMPLSRKPSGGPWCWFFFFNSFTQSFVSQIFQSPWYSYLHSFNI